MDLTTIFQILRRGAWLLALGAIVGIGAGCVSVASTTPVYESGTRLFVAVQTGDTTSASELAQGGSAAQQRIETYSAVATTDGVLGPVIESLGLETSVDELAATVTAKQIGDSSLLRITVRHTVPVYAAEIADAIGESLDAAVGRLERPLADGTSPVSISALQPARVPTSPVAPDVPVTLGLGLAVGLGAAVGLLFARALLDTRVTRADDAGTAVGAPVLGSLGFDPNGKSTPLLVHSSPRSPLAEAYRDLRTNLSYLSTDFPVRSIMITSAMQSEGKTTLASNLALAMAETGARVLLVDADLRRPQVADRFGLEGAAGLTDVLVGRAEPEDVVQPWAETGLDVLPAGGIPPNPSELLGSQSMRTLLSAMTTAYDVVLVDAPPLLPVTDAAVLSKSCDGAVLVAAARRTRLPQLADAAERLRKIDGHLFGVVATMVPARNGRDFGYGAYGSYYAAAAARSGWRQRLRPVRARQAG